MNDKQLFIDAAKIAYGMLFADAEKSPKLMALEACDYAQAFVDEVRTRIGEINDRSVETARTSSHTL